MSWPKFHCISSKFLWDLSKLCLSRNSIACDLNYSKTFPGCALAKIQLHIIGTILRQSQIVPWPKFHCISSKLLWEISTLCLSQNSIASRWKYSKTVPKCVFTENQLHLIEIFLRQFHMVSRLKFHSILSVIFKENSKLCFSQNSIVSRWNYSETIPNFFFAKLPLHLIEIVLTQFQVVSWPKNHCISSKLFWVFSKLCLSQNSNARHRELF